MTPARQNHFLNYIKAFCMLLIIFTHYNFGNDTRNLFIFPFIVSMAVPILILLSGFNFTNSENNGGGNKLYVHKALKRFIRLSVPLAIIFLLEIYLLLHGGNLFRYFFKISLKGCHFLTGAWGPGSYYFPIMLQFIVLFPVLYKIIQKYQTKGLVGIFFVNLLYEILCVVCGIEFGLYRILCFRLLFHFALGIWIALNRDFNNKVVFALSVITGGLYIYFYKYFGGADMKLFQSIGSTSMMTGFYIFPIFCLMLRKFENYVIPVKFLDKSFNITGKASWHIFTVQMMYFIYFIYLKKEYLLNNMPSLLHMSINIAFCVSVGILFYYAETYATGKIAQSAKWIINKLRNLKNTA